MGDLAAKQQWLDAKAKSVLNEYGIPNIAAVLVRDNGVTVMHTAQGVRNSAFGPTPANLVDKTDYFVVGSVSKPITGLLLACLIKKGVLTWNTTIADVFPEFTSKTFRDNCGMNENFLEAKVYELMAHTAGINGTYYFALNDDQHSQGDTDPMCYFGDDTFYETENMRRKEWETLDAVVYQRYLYMLLCLKQPKYQYGASKNLGYLNKKLSGYGGTPMICVVMVERVTGQPFENVMAELLSGVLSGWQIKHGALPNGMQRHAYDPNTSTFVPKTIYNGPLASFISKFVIGGISCSVGGMARFIRYNLRALASNHASAFDVAQYQAPVTDYAQGGLVFNGPNREFLWHTGATSQCYASVEVYMNDGYGWAVMLNCNGGPALDAYNTLRDALRTLHYGWSSI